jgi:hypothetical protein
LRDTSKRTATYRTRSTIQHCAKAPSARLRDVVHLCQKILGTFPRRCMYPPACAVYQDDMHADRIETADICAAARRRRDHFVQEHSPSTGPEAGRMTIFPDHFNASGTVAENDKWFVAEVAEPMLDRRCAQFTDFDELRRNACERRFQRCRRRNQWGPPRQRLPTPLIRATELWAVGNLRFSFQETSTRKSTRR